MRMTRIFVGLIIVFACAAAFAQRIYIKNIAVVETLTDDRSDAAKRISGAEISELTNEIRRAAVRNLPSSRYNIMTTETVLSMGDAVLQECAGENCVIALGSKIGADYIVRGVISTFRDFLTLTVEIFETDYGMLMAAADPVRSKDPVELLEKTQAVCAAMYKDFQDRRSQVEEMKAARKAADAAAAAAGSASPPAPVVPPAQTREHAVTIDTLAEREVDTIDTSVEEQEGTIDTLSEEYAAVPQDEEDVPVTPVPDMADQQQPAAESEMIAEDWPASQADNRAFYFEALGGYHSAGSSTGWVARGSAAYFLRSEHLHKFGLALGIGAAGSEQGVPYNRTAVGGTVLRDTIEFTSTVVSLHVQPIYRIGSHKRRLDVMASVTVPLSASATLGGADVDVDAEIGYSLGAGGRYEFAGAAAEASEDAVSGGVLFYWAVTPLFEIVPSYTYTYFRIGDLKSGHLFSLRMIISL